VSGESTINAGTPRPIFLTAAMEERAPQEVEIEQSGGFTMLPQVIIGY